MKAQSKRLPYALKGCDAIFYSVFRYLDSAPDVRPMIDYDYSEDWEQWELDHADDDYSEYRKRREKEYDKRREEPYKSSCVGVGLTELNVTNFCNESCSTASVSADAYVKKLQI